MALVPRSRRGSAQEGARVAVNGRDAAAIEAVCKQIVAAGGDAIPVAADVTRFDDVERMRKAIEERVGPADVVVANAGGSPVRPGPVEDISEEDWHASVDANLTATFLTIKKLPPRHESAGPRQLHHCVVGGGVCPSPRSPIAYASAKAGVELLTKDVAAQAGPSGVRANCIAPETILTEGNLAAIPKDMQEGLVSQHPIRRLGTPQDIAQAAVFLASDEASWITGVVLDVAGGAVLV